MVVVAHGNVEENAKRNIRHGLSRSPLLEKNARRGVNSGERVRTLTMVPEFCTLSTGTARMACEQVRRKKQNGRKVMTRLHFVNIRFPLACFQT